MKTIILFFAFLPLIITAEAEAQTNGEIKRAVHQAGVIAKIFDGEMEMPPEDVSPEFFADSMQTYSCVLTAGFEISSASLCYNDVAILASGVRTVNIRCVREYTHTSSSIGVGNVSITTTTYRRETSDFFPVTINLEPDKCYSIEADMSGGGLFHSLKERVKNISIVELSDPKKIKSAKTKAAELLANPDKYMANTVTARNYRDYIDWWKSHPTALDGTYVSKNGKTQINIDGNRFKAYNSNYVYGLTTFLYGTCMFNDRTIVAHIDTIKTTKLGGLRSKASKEDVKAGRFTNVLYYKSADEVFDILSKESDEVSFLHNFFLKDEFRRRADKGMAASVVEEFNPDEVAASGMATLDIAWQVVDGALLVSGQGDIPGNPSWSSAVDKFTSAVIGDGITSLGHHSFAGTKIQSIVIGKDVSNLKTYAFFNCNELAVVEIKNPVPPKVGMFVFMSTPIGKARLIVPAGSKAAYEKDKNWKKFGTIEEL